ncbi:MAG: hypothetical protein V7603_5533 [Micromonosporaceae bacterium]
MTVQENLGAQNQAGAEGQGVAESQGVAKSQGVTRGAAVSGRSRLDSLTSLRFFAAFLVFISHIYTRIWYTGADPERSFMPALVMRLSLIGVEFFFLLSGFVLTWSARPTDSHGSFWRRRLAKIFPNHAVTWLVGLVLLLWTNQQVTAAQGTTTLFLVDAWTPDKHVQVGVNPVSWSLSCEAFFYLCFPLLLWAISKIPARRLWYYAIGCVLLIAAVPVLVMRLTPAEPKWSGLQATEVQVWLTYNFPLTRMLEFVLGILLARIVLTGNWYPRRFRYGLVLLPVAVLLAMSLYYPYGNGVLLVIPLAMVILAAAQTDIEDRRTFLRRPLWIWLGDLSFAFYMTHWLIMQYTYPLIDPHRRAGVALMLACSAAYLLVSVFASWLLYSVVERPVMRRWGRSRRAGAATGGRGRDAVPSSEVRSPAS